MPSKEFLEALEPIAGESKFNRVFNYARTNLPVVRVARIKYLQGGQIEVVLKNELDEECPGQGSSKLNALIDAISTKYPD